MNMLKVLPKKEAGRTYLLNTLHSMEWRREHYHKNKERLEAAHKAADNKGLKEEDRPL